METRDGESDLKLAYSGIRIEQASQRFAQTFNLSAVPLGTKSLDGEDGPAITELIGYCEVLVRCTNFTERFLFLSKSIPIEPHLESLLLARGVGCNDELGSNLVCRKSPNTFFSGRYSGCG